MRLLEYLAYAVVSLLLGWFSVRVFVGKAWSEKRKAFFTVTLTVLAFAALSVYRLNSGKDISESIAELVICPIHSFSYCPPRPMKDAVVGTSTDSDNSTPQSSGPISGDEKRPQAYMGFKAALGRLTLYLRDSHRPLVEGIWNAIPSNSALYTSNEGLSRTVGGWEIFYTDQRRNDWQAAINCWGKISVQHVQGGGNQFKRYIRPFELVVDNTDANAIALAIGGEAKADGLGGWLLAVDVDGRGVRPVWAGMEWFLRKQGVLIAVDAQTGEIYTPSTENKMRPLNLHAAPPSASWNGGFEETSVDALMGSSKTYYWWPRAYEDGEDNYIYNRALLNQELARESQRPQRDAASWFTTGVIHDALGDWASGINDLDRAAELAPGAKDVLYYRGLSYLVVRDLDKARRDFSKLNDKERGDGLDKVSLFKGDKGSNSLFQFMSNARTSDGYIPIVVQVGPLPLASMLSRATSASAPN